jgi:hypothetical protein
MFFDYNARAQKPTTVTDAAFQQLKAKAKKGDPEAQAAVGLKYAESGNFEEAASWYRKAAEQGHAKGQFYLGALYEYGKGVPQDSGEAVRWYRKSADQGLADAQNSLGFAYYRGVGVPQDYAEAVTWFRKAADQGDAYAQFCLGLCCQYGKGVPQNFADAVRWYRKAAEQGNADAQYNLGVMYGTSQGVPQDYAKALKWFRKAAEQGNALAQGSLGQMYDNGQGVPRDRAEAVKWYRKAAEQGNADAQYNLALIYAHGQGVPQDYAEAVKWYRKAAEQGDAEAQFNLGVMYENGRGVLQDYAEAVKWYRKAAEQGVAPAQNNLGQMYENGRGVPQDYVEAYKWSNLAASQGNAKGSTNRNNLALKMTPDQIAEGQRRSSAFTPRKGSPSPGEEPAISSVTPRFSGSGFFISQDGYLVTNFHLVEAASRIVIQTKLGTFPAQVVKTDAANDIALLKVSGSFQPLPVATSRAARLGDAIFTIGFPNIDVQGVEPKLTKGDISSLSGIQDDPRYFQVSLPVQPGNSGGPLINMSGNVIGLMTAKLDDLAMLKLTGSMPQNVSYALKGSFMNAFLETIPELAAKLKVPNATIDRKFEDIVREAQNAAVLVLIY